MNKKSIIIHNNGGKEKNSNLVNLNNKKFFNWVWWLCLISWKKYTITISLPSRRLEPKGFMCHKKKIPNDIDSKKTIYSMIINKEPKIDKFLEAKISLWDMLTTN